MTASELNHVGVAYRQAARRSDELRHERDALVRAALAEGWTHAAIAAEAGMTRGRVGQIAQKRDVS